MTSEAINSLSERAELFYRRLMSVADDYGRYWADPRILHCNVYHLRLDQVSEADVKQLLSECIAKKVLLVYGGGKYLEIQKFGQQTRSKSKFPEPTKQDLVNYSLIKCEAKSNPMSSLVGVEGVVGVEGERIDRGLKIFNAIESRIGNLYQRPKGTVSTYTEQSAISEISRRPEALAELAELEAFHKKPDNFFPQSMQKLLANWHETLDRARTYETRKKSHANHRPTNPNRNEGTYNNKPLSAAAKSKVL